MAVGALLTLVLTGVLSSAAAEQCHWRFTECRRLLRYDQPQKAKRCFAQYQKRCGQVEGAPDPLKAAALEDMAAVLSGTAPDGLTTSQGGSDRANKVDNKPFSVSDFMLGGTPELVLSSTLVAGASGFWAAGSLLSGLRTNQDASLPILIAAPSLGAVAGMVGSSAYVWLFEPTVGDAALLSSAMLVSTAYGVMLNFMLFDPDDFREVPWRFATMLTSGLVGTAVAAAVAPHLDVDAGDVGLMNSGAIWGAVLPLLYMSALAQDAFNSNLGMLVPMAGSVLAYDLLLGLSPLLSVQRPTTWLVEAGGVLGLLSGLALTPVLLYGNSTRAALMPMALGTTAGLALGTAACIYGSHLLGNAEHQLALLETPVVTPFVAPDLDHPERSPTVGLSLNGRF